jgi:2'-5' RNA ligase
MRLFLAIELPTKAQQIINNSLKELRENYPDFNWVVSENYHVTLYFFGETEKKEAIIERIKKNIFDQEGFHLYSGYLDFFMKKKIIIFLNFLREKKLEDLVKKINKEFYFDFSQQKKYLPHLTLARCRIPSKQQYFVLKKRLKQINIVADFPVKKVNLFQSILSGKKPVYKKVYVFDLL